MGLRWRDLPTPLRSIHNTMRHPSDLAMPQNERLYANSINNSAESPFVQIPHQERNAKRISRTGSDLPRAGDFDLSMAAVVMCPVL